MSKFIAVVCGVVLLGVAALAPAAARQTNASYVASPADVLFQQVAAKPCCYNNGEAFYSSPSTCRRYGGRVVRYEYCQRAFYGDYNDGYGGGGNYANKPCCYNNGQFFNATPRTCRRYGGRLVQQDRCNRYYSDQWGEQDYDNDGYGYGNPGYGSQNNLEKPCCFNNGQYFNTTPSTCRKYGGQVAPQEYCLRPY